MSGFACMIDRLGRDVTDAELEPMLLPLRPRGPDGEARSRRGTVGCVSTTMDPGDSRLALCVAQIGDLTTIGQVRIDDRDACVRRLMNAGCRVTTDLPDVALFAHGWAAFGERLLEWVLGDYAVVLHDRRARETTMVRDPFGVRLLYYALSRERLVASNTLAAVLAARGVPHDLNDDAITDFIAIGLNEDVASTIYRDVRRVPPGHFAKVGHDGDVRLTRWWRLPEPREVRRPGDADYVDGFRSVLDASVSDRLRAPSIAVMMSGGLDSTALASIASRLLKRSGAVGAVTVKSASAPPAEMTRALSVVTAHRLRHRVIDAEDFECMQALADETLATPEPFDEPDLAVWRALLRETGELSRVVLYGEDPDTILAPPDLPELLRATSPWRLASDVVRHLVRRRARPHLGVRDRLRALASSSEKERRAATPDWLEPELRRRRAERVADRSTPTHRTHPDMARNLGHPLWQSVLESLDAGVHGIPIDVRLPFLDQRVIEYALSVPAIPWLQRKHLLREAMAGQLPEAVRVAPKRGVPGMMQQRLGRWWDSRPAPFVPSAHLARFVDVAALRTVNAESHPQRLLEHLRLRILDRWLRDYDRSAASAAIRLQNAGR
ncbi:MAG: asparagine synthase-related protein [bacterium]